MKTHRFPGQGILKGILIVLLVILAFQSFGTNGLAAPAMPSHDLQEGENPPVLTCGCSSAALQVVLMIDDSGSMRTIDPQFRRDQSARGLVDALTTLPDAQAAVIHFTDEVKEKSEWIKINPANLAELHREIDRNQEFTYTLEPTDFMEVFTVAKNLFIQAATGNCTHRSILLFSDGTPEGPQGPLTGIELAKEFDSVGSNVLGISKLDEIYLVGFKVNAKYLNEEVRQGWYDLMNRSTVVEKLSTSQVGYRALYSLLQKNSQIL